jgi:hypothetical protein
MLLRPTNFDLPECDCHLPTMVSAGRRSRPVGKWTIVGSRDEKNSFLPSSGNLLPKGLKNLTRHCIHCNGLFLSSITLHNLDPALLLLQRRHHRSCLCRRAAGRWSGPTGPSCRSSLPSKSSSCTSAVAASPDPLLPPSLWPASAVLPQLARLHLPTTPAIEHPLPTAMTRGRMGGRMAMTDGSTAGARAEWRRREAAGRRRAREGRGRPA